VRFRRNTLGFVGAITLVAAMVLPATTAGAQTTYDVSVSQFLEGAPAESMRFLPYDIDVHQGDTLHFAGLSFHTATMLPAGQGVVEWFNANATYGTSQPWAPVALDPDDGPGAYELANSVLNPSSTSCGGAAQPACSYDGTSVLNSGTPAFFGEKIDFSATVNAAPGSSFWVVCIWHGPNMRMKVDVVAASEPATTLAEADAQSAAALSQDTDSAAALHERFSGRQSFHTRTNGTRVWDAWAGVGNRHVELFGFYPRTLRIARGDTVQWHFDSMTFEDHTVTFPIDKARNIANAIGFVCDPDGDAGPGPDNPPDMEAPPFCNNPAQLEIELPNRFIPRLGNGTFTGRDLESSGVRGSNSAFFEGDRNYRLQFGASSPGEGFGYLCMIHTFMRGKVVVG